MSNVPECLQPAVEQLQKYETQISALESRNRNLDDDIQTLIDEKSVLNEQIAQSNETHRLSVEAYEQEKATLRDLNVVVSDQLREKIDEINALKESNIQLNEQNSRVSTESIRVNAGQEALSHQSQRLNEELDALRLDNKVLKEEIDSLRLVNDVSIQRERDLQEGESDDSVLVAEIDRLKQELLKKGTQTTTGDSSFLESENERLVQRHGEITQEKMQASAKMHAAQKELEETVVKLDTANKNVEQLEFELQGLHNLHKNLTEEKESLADDNQALIGQKAELDERVLRLSEDIQRVSMEKDVVTQELTQEHIKGDGLAEEVNHLRMKSRRLAEEIKELREGPQETLEGDVPVLEIETSEDEEERLDVEIVTPSGDSGPHFPGEGHSEGKY